MTPKEHLEQIQDIEIEIRHLGVEKRRWMELATNITPGMNGERVQSSGSKQKMADTINSGVDDDKEIDRQIDELKAKRQGIINDIWSLKNPYKDILYRVYVEYQTLKEVAYERKESYSWITTAHGIALKKIAGILESRKATKSN